ncbi:MAG: class I SAM-dependent methyltransferase [Candidatus Marinimicrobia bacterium]|nr:class I SAM-dependent methyltransferase [Candidatus Neomarinimicrobiota bacterium]MBT3501030.1 class I SAM-dependent methyltransferase [Candidatus Neomarinimicrobiota bacterium]MBT3838826.1 class I SAM-dependent methyltransferase [Candidatus Neomarinimicrobiota bacterium]MBT3998803.1 class I SAM-dependent methyltransferase [Candidatus Neomarinimicrobiota bacterium]MBT4282637.1 class I SAM-dependent methyltransferase [Candidatus Neomarinimicrobiota bacterium]
MKISTEIFSEWALNGKDEGMEENHRAAVSEMLSIISNNRSKPFSFIDAGCGNGWVVRLMKKHSLCHLAIGIDGAVEMIKKAKTIDPDGIYFCSDLLKWIPEQKVDLIHSMEVFYYLKHPSELIRHMALNCLKPGGEMIMGVDFYLENKKSHSWPVDLNTHMSLFSEHDWVTMFKTNGFNQVQSFRVNVNNEFPGTLVVRGKLKN